VRLIIYNRVVANGYHLHFFIYLFIITMGRQRVKYFEIDDIQECIDFGTYALMMYYAKQLNSAKAKLLFDATLSEWGYRVNYDLPDGGLDGIDDLEAHFVPAKIQEAIAFIDEELVPALNEEPQDLFAKYGGGEDNFRTLYNTNPDYLIALGLTSDEFYWDDPEFIAEFLGRLKEVFEYSFTVNRPYEVYVY
jgi:hypothetical protein